MLRAPAFVLLTVPDFSVKGNGQRGFEGSKEKKQRGKKGRVGKRDRVIHSERRAVPRRRQRSLP